MEEKGFCLKFHLGFLFFSIFSLSLCFSGVQSFPSVQFIEKGQSISDVNGGTTCAGCSIIVAVVEQLMGVYNESASESIARLCNYLPEPYRAACHVIAVEFGPPVIDILNKYENADVVCNAIGLCHQDAGQPRCHIYGKSKGVLGERVVKFESLVQNYRKKGVMRLGADVCQYPIVSDICKLLERAFTVHEPLEDLDGDRFSTFQTFRGSSWRGKDCYDVASHMYPGVKVKGADVAEDTNCNGIYGRDPDSGKFYEDMWCNSTGQRGTVVLGDSVSAHFHVPPQWLTAPDLSVDIFRHLPFILENEFDWPQTSAATGYMEMGWPEIEGPTDSLYLRMRGRNRCNHRDFQNIAVNGADSGNLLSNKVLASLARDQQQDHPLLITYALVGNDVCNGHQDTIAHMTTPEQYKVNVMKTLETLNATVPLGTKMVMIGLADGRLLYDNLKGRYHPLGQTRHDITYDDVYTFLSCLQVSPCNGWLSTNETLRNLTTQRAFELSHVLKDIATNYSTHYKNFEFTYMVNPFETVFASWISQGGEGWQLIEPVDGFHTNQYANALTAKAVWEWVEKNKPDWLGPVNPHNDDIEKKFGDQGGYL